MSAWPYYRRLKVYFIFFIVSVVLSLDYTKFGCEVFTTHTFYLLRINIFAGQSVWVGDDGLFCLL
ncbi:hypothetical protein DSUL_20577 [Desulfovibrionales bacterium]